MGYLNLELSQYQWGQFCSIVPRMESQNQRLSSTDDVTSRMEPSTVFCDSTFQPLLTFQLINADLSSFSVAQFGPWLRLTLSINFQCHGVFQKQTWTNDLRCNRKILRPILMVRWEIAEATIHRIREKFRPKNYKRHSVESLAFCSTERQILLWWIC